MATELDVSKSRRFDMAMSRRTRRSTSLVACFQYQYAPSLAQQRHQELKEFLQCQDAELKALQQCEDAEQLVLCLDEDEELKEPEQFQGVKKLPLPPRAVDNVPRFSLQELIQQKQLQTGEAKPTSKVGGHGDSALPDHKVSGSGGAGAGAGGTTLAMVIKRPEGGKKSMGMLRRCVKALNQMIKTKHGSKKNLHL